MGENLIKALAEVEWRARYWLARTRMKADALRMTGHQCPERRPIGRMAIGEIEFSIDRAYFNQGHLVLTGTAGVGTTGHVEGHVRIHGLDGEVAFRGTDFKEVGVKPAFSTWQFTETIQIQGTQPPPDEFDYQQEWDGTDYDLSWVSKIGKWLANG